MYFSKFMLSVKSSIKLGNKFRKVFISIHMYTFLSLPSLCILNAQCMRNIIRYIFSNLCSTLFLLKPPNCLPTRPSTAIKSSWMYSDFELRCIENDEKWCVYVHGNKLISSRDKICFSILAFCDHKKKTSKWTFSLWDQCTKLYISSILQTSFSQVFLKVLFGKW